MSFTIAEVAERTGLTAHTIRYYERDGLLIHDVERLSSGHRAYSDADVRGIEMIARLRATGMPITKVRQYAQLARAGEHTIAARHQLLVEHRDAVLAEMAVVREHLAAIDYKLGVYESALTSSALEGVSWN